MTNALSEDRDSIIIWRNLFRVEYPAVWHKFKSKDVDLSLADDLCLGFDDSIILDDVFEKIIHNAGQFDIVLSPDDARRFICNFASVYRNLVREFGLDYVFEACLCCQAISDMLSEALTSGNYKITETTSDTAGTGEIQLVNGWKIGIYIRYSFRGLDYIFLADGTRIFNDGLNSDFVPTDLMPHDLEQKLFRLFTDQ